MNASKPSTAEREGRNREAVDYDRRQLSEKGTAYWALHNALIVDALADIDPALVLDAGCGTGLVTRALATLGHDVVALDFSEASLAVMRRKRLAKVHPVQGNLVRLPFETGCFSAVVSSLVMQHIPPADRAPVYREFARCLIPGGTLVVIAYNEARFRRAGLPTAGWFGSGIPYYSFSWRGLHDEARRGGFGEVVVRPLGLSLYARGCPGGRLIYPALNPLAHRVERWIQRWLWPNRAYPSDYWFMSARRDAGAAP